MRYHIHFIHYILPYQFEIQDPRHFPNGMVTPRAHVFSTNPVEFAVRIARIRAHGDCGSIQKPRKRALSVGWISAAHPPF